MINTHKEKEMTLAEKYFTASDIKDLRESLNGLADMLLKASRAASTEESFFVIGSVATLLKQVSHDLALPGQDDEENTNGGE